MSRTCRNPSIFLKIRQVRRGFIISAPFADNGAVDVSPPIEFTNPANISQTLDEFMNYCRITGKPNIAKDLFV
jgi:hypothetical protein